MKSRKFPDDIEKYIRHEDGRLYWKDRPRCHFKNDMAKTYWERNFIGKECGTKHNSGYLRVSIKIDGVNRFCMSHIVVWKIVYGEWPKGNIDHIDHNRLNNKIENLRVVSHKENSRNQSKHKTNTSGYTGVTWCEEQKKWRASIIFDGRKHCLGRFKDKSDAVRSRYDAEKKFGFHENHGK